MSKIKMSAFPIPREIISQIIEKNHLPSPGSASIREIVSLVSRIESQTGIDFVRMEMGIPGLVPPAIGINAEIEALRNGVAADYPNINGIKPLKDEASRFAKLFLDIDVSPQGCVPTIGSMMGSLISFVVANRTDRKKEGTLFIDPGFPVHKQQIAMLGQDYFSFDVFNYRGKKLKAKLESYFETGKVSTILYSNPNNPSWMCLNEDELETIGQLSSQYNVIVIEDLAYFGMDFRKDYLKPGHTEFQPTVAKYTDDYIILLSGSKMFSYAGQRIGLMFISDYLFDRKFPDLLRYFSSDRFGHAAVYGALYGMSAGVTHSVQYGFSAFLKAVNDGDYNFLDDLKEYGEKAGIMKRIFLSNGFKIVYDKDIDEPIGDGFYFTVSYPGMTGQKLLEELLYYGISAISLHITGSDRHEGLRICVSKVKRDQFNDMEIRLKKFMEDHPFKN
jgi:aspartate/methionine/tyrosine aminotransferase